MNCRHTFRSQTYRKLALLTAMASQLLNPCPSLVQGAEIDLTQIGSPNWRPADFQLFTAPAAPFPDAFLNTLDQLLPLEGPGTTTYTPHLGPYDTELSTNAAAAGFVNQNVFPQSAIMLDPNGVYFAFMMLPDPGVTGSSRDFASGPVIPNSLFPMTTHAEMWLDDVLVETLQDGIFNIRPGDAPFDGASHRAPAQVVWYPWADDPNAGPLGDHEIRWSLTDVQGNGWEMVAPFTVVPEPSALLLGSFGAIALILARRYRRGNVLRSGSAYSA
ncbi:MAG: PEP-CTERM sorting domain-containing protein [Planctomycetia bacterium]|nr:PEP-CTERM sorting domain-containing protein [Planctomycetia bacterium]